MNDLTVLATICLVAMIRPGPDFILVTKNALSCDKPQALATALGVVAGTIIHATYCILGLALVITQSVVAFSIVKYAGAAYLFYLGVMGLRSKSAKRSDQLRNTPSRNISIAKAFSEGFLCNLLNPKLAVFLISLFTQFVSIDAVLGDKLVIAAIFVGENALYWPSLALVLQSQAVRQIFYRVQGHIDRICGALLVGLGAKVAFSRQ